MSFYLNISQTAIAEENAKKDNTCLPISLLTMCFKKSV